MKYFERFRKDGKEIQAEIPLRRGSLVVQLSNGAEFTITEHDGMLAGMTPGGHVAVFKSEGTE